MNNKITLTVQSDGSQAFTFDDAASAAEFARLIVRPSAVSFTHPTLKAPTTQLIGSSGPHPYPSKRKSLPPGLRRNHWLEEEIRILQSYIGKSAGEVVNDKTLLRAHSAPSILSSWYEMTIRHIKMPGGKKMAHMWNGENGNADWEALKKMTAMSGESFRENTKEGNAEWEALEGEEHAITPHSAMGYKGASGARTILKEIGP